MYTINVLGPSGVYLGSCSVISWNQKLSCHQTQINNISFKAATNKLKNIVNSSILRMKRYICMYVYIVAHRGTFDD